jgi:hypothetical protein
MEFNSGTEYQVPQPVKNLHKAGDECKQSEQQPRETSHFSRPQRGRQPTFILNVICYSLGSLPAHLAKALVPLSSVMSKPSSEEMVSCFLHSQGMFAKKQSQDSFALWGHCGSPGTGIERQNVTLICCRTSGRIPYRECNTMISQLLMSSPASSSGCQGLG